VVRVSTCLLATAKEQQHSSAYLADLSAVLAGICIYAGLSVCNEHFVCAYATAARMHMKIVPHIEQVCHCIRKCMWVTACFFHITNWSIRS